MLIVGQQFPSYALQAVPPDLEADFVTVTPADADRQWRVVFFWPLDFTAVCPTEVAGFGAHHDEFVARGVQVLGVSTDSEYAHRAWRRSHPALRDLPYPMASDMGRDLATACGILDVDNTAHRATFVIDPDNVIQFVMVTNGDTGRNVAEVLRVIDAMQTGEMTPCDWTPGATTLGS
jgi:alkyl hydroperoxide reductase subunit AhpC